MATLLTLVFALAGAAISFRWFAHPNKAELTGFFATCLFYISYFVTYQLMKLNEQAFTTVQFSTVVLCVCVGAYLGRQRRQDTV